ncbi:uncharacterized protein EAF01_007552 [Botrytis porri]|uniref:Uncharacterized protein n=1 Tax=Botrytis porri TaxID=87229 RepID=A0A4Z1KVI8_9HELO|nr:uncharacterized protein EAF01_007552 [Botrytis porri]KAF7900250.1 hypothetical protein EAF01_007552 [Botrytis porri]TGO88564.1 hypothetical protein BPOR_0154g00040 [Botrytis porri]
MKCKRREVSLRVQEISTFPQLKSLIEVAEIEQRGRQAENDDHSTNSREEKPVAQLQKIVLGKKKQIIYNLQESLKQNT